MPDEHGLPELLWTAPDGATFPLPVWIEHEIRRPVRELGEATGFSDELDWIDHTFLAVIPDWADREILAWRACEDAPDEAAFRAADAILEFCDEPDAPRSANGTVLGCLVLQEFPIEEYGTHKEAWRLLFHDYVGEYHSGHAAMASFMAQQLEEEYGGGSIVTVDQLAMRPALERTTLAGHLLHHAVDALATDIHAVVLSDPTINRLRGIDGPLRAPEARAQAVACGIAGFGPWLVDREPQIWFAETDAHAEYDEWTPESVREVLANPVVLGLGPFPRFVSDDEWLDMMEEVVMIEGPAPTLEALRDAVCDTFGPAAQSVRAEGFIEYGAQQIEYRGARSYLTSLLETLRRELDHVGMEDTGWGQAGGPVIELKGPLGN